MDEGEIRRTLTWFDKATERSVGQEDLKGACLDDLRLILGVAATDPVDPMMLDCYSVGEVHAARLQRFVNIRIEPSRFDYFVEATRQTDQTDE